MKTPKHYYSIYKLTDLDQYNIFGSHELKEIALYLKKEYKSVFISIKRNNFIYTDKGIFKVYKDSLAELEALDF
jgi:hypothetical protein